MRHRHCYLGHLLFYFELLSYRHHLIMGAGRLIFHASGYAWCMVYARWYRRHWKWKDGFSPPEGRNLPREAPLQVSHYDKICVKNFCRRCTGILEEVANIVSLVLKKKESKSEFHEPSSFLHCITGNISQGWRWGMGRGNGCASVWAGSRWSTSGKLEGTRNTEAQLPLSSHCLGQHLQCG